MDLIQELGEFRSLGCKDLKKCSLAYRVYTDLSQSKRLTKLEKFYEPEFDLVFLRGARRAASIIYLPTLSNDAVDLLQVEQIQKKLLAGETKILMLAVCDTSSNVLYYELKSGFVKRQGSTHPSAQGSTHPSAQGTSHPSAQGTTHPSAQGSTHPSAQGSTHPSAQGTTHPSAQASTHPSAQGSTHPSAQASTHPSAQGSTHPSAQGSTHPHPHESKPSTS